MSVISADANPMQVQRNRRMTTDGAPNRVGVPRGFEPNSTDQKIADQVIEIAARLVQAPASAELTMLEWAFARIGAVIKASVVGARELRDDGCLHFVAGWSRFEGLLKSDQPILVPRDERLPRHIISTTDVQEMPVTVSDSDMAAWGSFVGRGTPQSVFCPMIDSQEPKGFLCLVADDGVTWDETVLTALATVTALVTQFRARVRAERSMQQQIAFHALHVSIGDRFMGLVTGEEEESLNEALADIGEMLDLISIGVWEQAANNRAHLTLRWLKDGVVGESNPTFSVDIADLPDAVKIPRGGRVKHVGRPVPSIDNAFDDLDVDREILAVVMSAVAGTGRGALVIGHEPGRVWEPWELTGLESFANRIPVLRERLAVEEQLVASFHAAPIGIAIRNEDGRLTDCNDAFVAFLGYSSEMELLGSGPAQILAEDRAVSEARYMLTPEFDDSRVELPFQRKDGSVVWGRLSTRELQLGPTPMSLTHIEDITAEREERRRLEWRASTDELTGVANRHEMKAILSRLLPGDTAEPFENNTGAVALLLLDLDGFKEVNDLHGHAIGDRVLQEVSRRIVEVSRDTDTVVRLGGDEFVVILPGPIEERQAARTATRIRDAVARPLSIGGSIISLTVSIGMATHSCITQTADHLLAAADQNMYASKRVLAAPDLGHANSA